MACSLLGVRGRSPRRQARADSVTQGHPGPGLHRTFTGDQHHCQVGQGGGNGEHFLFLF